MTDFEIARIVRRGRREGFAHAFTIAFVALLVTAPIAGFVSDRAAALMLVAGGVLGALAIGSTASNRDPDPAE